MKRRIILVFSMHMNNGLRERKRLEIILEDNIRCEFVNGKRSYLDIIVR